MDIGPLTQDQLYFTEARLLLTTYIKNAGTGDFNLFILECRHVFVYKR